MNSMALLFTLHPPPPPTVFFTLPRSFLPLLSEIGHWESILAHKSNHIILSFSISTLSPPSYTSFLLYHSPISPLWLPLSESFAISLTALRKGHLMWGMMQVQEHRFFSPPFLRCNPIRWAADIRLKSHRLHGCFYVQVEHFSSLRCLL